MPLRKSYKTFSFLTKWVICKEKVAQIQFLIDKKSFLWYNNIIVNVRNENTVFCEKGE